MPGYRFCPRCATELVPFEDEFTTRMGCPDCGWIHYRNPTVGVAVVLVEEAGLLLGRRGRGGWCVPCGHVEWGEEVAAAARREFMEETGLEVHLDGIVAVLSNFHDPESLTVGIWYRGRRVGGELRAGADLVDVRFFPLDDLPELCFPTDRAVAQLLGAHSPPGPGHT